MTEPIPLTMNDEGQMISDAHLQSCDLTEIERQDSMLCEHFKEKFFVNKHLSRQLVSFQANKTRPYFRWYKYKEAFSAALVEYLLTEYNILSGRLLDPFAGSGTALFTASQMGLDADGIELLPVAQEIINARVTIEQQFSDEDFTRIRYWIEQKPWETALTRCPITTLRITDGAYPPQTLEKIERYLAATDSENDRVKRILLFALLSILESISYTRKDGQYLRWDTRSGRRAGTRPFDKGKILEFNEAIAQKLSDIVTDSTRANQFSLFSQATRKGAINLYGGSCLDILPQLPENTYNAIITSPPYCNRYDYTRTYALELALMGVNEDELKELRQQMLSCTVENREKELIKQNTAWNDAINAADNQDLLQSILCYLEDLKSENKLNNSGIPRMVRGYFYELACIIAECHRVLKPNATMFMVNDNVRYAGANVSVDMILSAIAEDLGFTVENILVLPNGKGNSSQQMGKHGRTSLRKCIYVWRKI